MSDLHKFLTALTTHFGERNADDFAIWHGVKTEVGFLNTFDDRFAEAHVPRLNLNQAGVGRADGGARLERLHRAVGFNHDGFDHGRRGFAGVNATEFVQGVVDGFFHAALRVGENGMAHGNLELGMRIWEWRSRRGIWDRPGSAVNEGADFLAQNGFADGMPVIEIEDHDRHVVIETEREGGRVHDIEALFERVDVGDLVVFDRVGILFRVLVVDAVDLGGLHDDIGVHLAGAECGGGIGREIRVAGAGDEDDHAAFFEVADGAAEDERFGDLVHRDGALDAGGDAELFETVHDRQAVDNRGQHAHVVAGRAVDAALGAIEAAEDIAAANHHADFHAQVVDFLHLLTGLLERRGVDGVAVLAAAKDFAAEFEDDTFVFNRGFRWLLRVHDVQVTLSKNSRQ